MISGTSPDRRPGMHLARLDICVPIQGRLKRIPAFEPDPEVPVIQTTGRVNGVLQLGLRWPA